MKKSNVVNPPAVHSQDTSVIWKEFSSRLFDFIARQIKNRDDAEDVLQEVFEKIHLKKSSLNDKSKLVSWLFQLTRNAIIDYYRSQKLTRLHTDDVFMEEEVEKAYENLACCLTPFINQLPDMDKKIIVKIDMEGKGQKAMAEEWGIPYATFKSSVQRARKKLKWMFLECCTLKFDRRGGVVNEGSGSTCGNC